MKLLEDKILQEGIILSGDILKVDNFLNHQVDPNLMMEMGKDFYEHFKDKKVTKVLTLEVSGIAMALTTALKFGAPMVFAKKIESKTLVDDMWEAEVHSFTKNKTYTIRVSKKYLTSDDKVLIIDDFLAKGQALSGIKELCDQAGAEVVGIGIAIEKKFQGGGEAFRKLGIDLYSQATIKEFRNGKVVFE